MSSLSTIIVAEDPAHVAEIGANRFLEAAEKRVSATGRFVAALSGGSTPRAMHRRLAREPFRSQVPWVSTHLFWVDERCVPVFSPYSNFGAAREDFLGAVPIPADQVHPMPGDKPPAEGAATYQRCLEAFFSVSEPPALFDLVFLGVGRDGHTASLFPNDPALAEDEKWVAAVKGGNPDVHRLTLTCPVLNRSMEVIFMLCGAEKADIAKTLLEEDEPDLPARRIHPVKGEPIWLLDRAAASLLKREGSTQ